MNLLFGVPWLDNVLFWACICFLTQKGYSFEQDFSLNDDAFSSHAGVFDPQTSNQFNSGASLNANHDSDGHINEMLRDPVHRDDNEDASSATSFSEEMVQSSAPSLQNSDLEDPGYGHPFDLLVKEHTQQRKKVEGVSFPTMRNFKQFVQKMKSSFLKPGSDLRRHFQTARDIVENELASKAGNTDEEPRAGSGFDSTKEDNAHSEADENEAWKKNRNTEFEEGDMSPNYQMPSRSVLDPVDSTASFITNNAHDNSGLGVDAAYHQLCQSEATPCVLNNNELSDSSGDTSAPGSQNNNVQSTSPQLYEQIPPDSFFGEDYSSAPDLNYYDNKMTTVIPQTPEKYIQTSDYTPQSKDHFAGYQKQSVGFKLGDFQSEEPSRWTPNNFLSAPKPRSPNSYRKSVYVSAPRGQLHFPDYVPKHREIPTPTFPAYLESNRVNENPPVHRPASVGSVSSSSENPSSQSLSGHVGVQTSSPNDITMNPSSSLYDGYLKAQGVSVTQEKSNPSEQNLISAIQESKQITEDTLLPFSNSLESTQSGVLSQLGYATFNSPSSAPASETDLRLVGNEVKRKNTVIKNEISYGAVRPPDLFSASQGRRLGGYAGRLQTFIQPTNEWRRPADVNREPGNTAYQHPKPRVSAPTLNGLFWRKRVDTKRLPQTGFIMSSPSAHTYVVKSQKRYVRGKVFRSKTRYDPHQLNDVITKNTAGKGLKNQEYTI
ncbi:uncharacterized protein LOC132973470 [Labrus mixtus]|uniref:uncharacterized protein LOC132973470 n=1 Tax=Labrus mixtus TaxID=508554 RepID=UPI0029C017AA|nr:uncharacterized protein LOC132973470 [Labrus mixtus]